MAGNGRLSPFGGFEPPLAQIAFLAAADAGAFRLAPPLRTQQVLTYCQAFLLRQSLVPIP